MLVPIWSEQNKGFPRRHHSHRPQVACTQGRRAYDIVQEEHEEVLARLEASDADGAAEAMRRHLEPFLQR